METKIFKRKAYAKLLQWKQQSNGKTALLIEGARRIGKSTLVEHFAQKEYDSHILIDFANPLLPISIISSCACSLSITSN